MRRPLFQPAIRTSSGAVIVPLACEAIPPLIRRLDLPEVSLAAKEEVHLTLLSSAEASALDAATGEPAEWSDFAEKFQCEAQRFEITGSWWLLRSEKPEGPAWSVVARLRCPAFAVFRRRISIASARAVSADAPPHVTLFVAGDPRGIGLPTGLRFRATRVRRLDASERMKAAPGLHGGLVVGGSEAMTPAARQ